MSQVTQETQDSHCDFQAKVEEFRRLYVNPETGIVRADPDTGKPNSLSVWVSDWSALENLQDKLNAGRGV